MIISDDFIATKALAAVFVFYRDIESNNGGNEAIGIDTAILDCFLANFGYKFVNCKIDENKNVCTQSELKLIREGAVIYLLCELGDAINSYQDDYLLQPWVKDIIKIYENGKMSAIPEASKLFSLLSVPESELDYEAYRNVEKEIRQKYITGWYERLLADNAREWQDYCDSQSS